MGLKVWIRVLALAAAQNDIEYYESGDDEGSGSTNRAC